MSDNDIPADLREKFAQPGYVPTEEDVAAVIAIRGSWGMLPKYRECEVCGFHVIGQPECPVDHAALIADLRRQLRESGYRNAELWQQLEDCGAFIMRGMGE